jgi:hypothetical protein
MKRKIHPVKGSLASATLFVANKASKKCTSDQDLFATGTLKSFVDFGSVLVYN